MSLCYRDRAYCASPKCDNKCGRKITVEERCEAIKADLPIAWGYFCDVPQDVYQYIKKTVKIQPAPKAGKISVDKIQRAVDSVSKPKKKK